MTSKRQKSLEKSLQQQQEGRRMKDLTTEPQQQQIQQVCVYSANSAAHKII